MTPKWEANSIEVLGGASLRIVSETKWGREDMIAERAWIVAGNRREALPTPPPRSYNPQPLTRFVFSPDTSVLLADRKVGSGINEMFIYLLTAGLRYRLASKEPLNRTIQRRFGRPQKELGNDPVEFILFQRWRNSGRIAEFACGYGERNRPIWYAVDFEPHSGSLANWKKVASHDVLPWESLKV